MVFLSSSGTFNLAPIIDNLQELCRLTITTGFPVINQVEKLNVSDAQAESLKTGNLIYLPSSSLYACNVQVNKM